MTPVDPRLLRRAAPVRRLLLICAGLGVVTAVLVVVQASLLSRLIAGTVETRRLDRLAELLGWLALVIMVRALVGWVNGVVAQCGSAAVKSQLRSEIMAARLGRADVTDQTASRPDTATLIMTVTTGLDALDGYFARYLPQLVLALVVPAVVVVAIGSVDVISAIIVVVTLPLVPLFMILVGRLTEARARRRWRTQARLAHHFADLVAGLPTLQVFGRAHGQSAGIERSEAAHRQATVATLRIALLSSLVLELVAMLSVALVAVGVGLRVVEGHLDLGLALFVLLLAPEAYRPLREVGTHYHDAADGLAAVDQAFAIIDGDPAPIDVHTTIKDSIKKSADARVSIRGDARASIGRGSGGVVWRGVSVRYPGADRDALAPIDLDWAPGEVLALAGPSGVGKSTLLAALLGRVPLRTGMIMIDGIDVSTIDPIRWRRQFAVVPQDPQLITATVADNVCLATPATPDQVRRALVDAGAADLDPERWLPAADDPLSAGELRRVALARALLRVQAGVARSLVLDEPTAGLDSEAEAAVIESVRRLGVAMLVVSHRPAVVAAADRVITLGDADPAPLTGPELVGVGS